MSNPSIIFHQGLRCTKVPREPRATDSTLGASSAGSSFESSPTTEPVQDSTTHEAPDQGDGEKPTSTSFILPTNGTDSGTGSFSNQTTQPSESHPGLGSINPHNTFTPPSTAQPTSSDIPSVSEDDSSGPPYGTIFGILFGILGFIALIALIIFFVRHRSRQTAEAEEQDDRASANSRTGLRQDFRSHMSYLSDPSPPPPDFHPDIEPQPYQNYSGPVLCSDTAEQGTTPYMIQPVVNQNKNPISPTRLLAADRDSTHSATSLGSTLILPGRSSMGSDWPSSPNSTGMGPAASKPTVGAVLNK
ncbi:hypothetical protein BDV18DRAFT_159227 [Aspergillus unguis]